MVQLLKTIAYSTWFSGFVTLMILAAAVLVGLETYPSIVASWGSGIHLANDIILGVFVVEVLIKVGAEGRYPHRYFYDPWNVFDFLIVGTAFLPLNAQYVTVLRLLRLLRVLRLVRALPKLQLLVSALLKSIPSMVYVSLLLGLLFYVYGVAAVFMFGKNDPIHFGSLEISMVSLYRVVTLEDWTDIMYIQMYGCDNYGYEGNEALCTSPTATPVVGSLFFISFVMLGTMIVLNLFIGVIMNGMDEAQREYETHEEYRRLEEAGDSEPALSDELRDVTSQLEDLRATVDRLAQRAESLDTGSLETRPLGTGKVSDKEETS